VPALRSIALFCGTSTAADDVIDLQQTSLKQLFAYLFIFAMAIGQNIVSRSGPP
jgi:hypothetical protein